MSESKEAASHDDDANETAEGDQEEELLMKGITDPRETDVLCGRGGAALRHPGNQTYRRLVNLNKGLYITCLKTEKLKISRSIVAAIREQDGRFLEREAKKQTWYDIGDKKAIEKTSQALREGQPKLRQKMIDTGQIAPSHGTSMEHQFGNGIYNPGGRPTSMSSGVSSGVYSSDGSHYSSMGPTTMNQASSMSSSNMDMPPPPSRTLSNDMSTDMMMQRLSLTSIGPRSIPSWTPSITSSMDGGSVRSRLRPSLQPAGSGVAGDLGFTPESTISIMSDFSAYGINDSNYGGMDPTGMDHNMYATGNGMGIPPPPPPAMSPMMESPSMRSGYDRRRLFAKMKYSRQGSGRSPGSQRSAGDGMPDIHMVDSQFSLMSNLSGHGSRHEGSNALSNLSGHGDMHDGTGLGSRRSLMSGLSRISDHSGNSVFSDLSKKVGSTGMSTRSIAMSEVSEIEEGFEEVEFNFDSIAKTST